MRYSRVLAATLVGAAVAAATAVPADAARPKAEKFLCKLGRALFKDNTGKALGGPTSVLSPPPEMEPPPDGPPPVALPPLPGNFQISAQKTKKLTKGRRRVDQFTINVISPNVIDPRDLVGKQVFAAGAGLIAHYDSTVLEAEQETGEPTTWVTSGSGDPPFTLTWKKFDAVNSQLYGVFSGTLVPGPMNSSTKVTKVTRGTFIVDVDLPEN